MSLLVLSLQVEDDRIMNLGQLLGLENFHITVIDLSSCCAKIYIMIIHGILKTGEPYAHSIS